MIVIRKSDGKIIEVEPIFRMDDRSDNQRYYQDREGNRYLPSDFDFDVEEAEQTETDLRISVAELREVLMKFEAEQHGRQRIVSEALVDEIINRVKKEI